MSNDRFIDVERAIKSKNPRLHRWMPRWLLRYIKKVVHEDESNAVIAENVGKNGFEFSCSVIKHLDIKVETFGIENIPKSGGAIVAMNHPLGGMDAIAMIREVYPLRNDIRFVVNDLLMQLENLRDLFAPVNKHGSNSKESLQSLLDLYASEKLVFVFPAGLVSRRKKGRVQDLEWKKTFITRSRRFEKSIIPVFVEGELTNFFYRLSNLRTRVGIKANLEMFYLVDELFKQKGKTLRIVFGEPIPHTTFDGTRNDFGWAQWVKEKSYELKQRLPSKNEQAKP
jgi:putative hemolysin